jgi:hypothetical protein
MNERYRVIEGSQSGHCCFDYTVVDTTKKHQYFKDQFVQVCEAFDKESADLIAKALNHLNSLQ